MNDRNPPLTFRQAPEPAAPIGPAAGSVDGYARRAAILAAVTLVLTALGPFGTFKDFAFLPRLAYWGGLILCGAVAFDVFIRLGFQSVRLCAYGWRGPAAAAIFLTSLIQAAAVWTVERSFRAPLPIGLAELYAYVLLTTALISAAPLWRELRARGLLSPSAPPSPAPAVAAAPPERPPFFDRIPPRIAGDLLALRMEDHYLRVHTDRGDDLILMRLRDAARELAGVDGMQVHRSWWVAADAVTAAERDGDGRATLILRNGLRVPVSRSRTAAVRSAGWLDASRVSNRLKTD